MDSPLQAILFWIAVTLAPPDTSQILVKGPDEAWAWTKQASGWSSSDDRSVWVAEGTTVTRSIRGEEKPVKEDVGRFVKGVKDHDWKKSASLKLEPNASLAKEGETYVYTLEEGTATAKRYDIRFRRNPAAAELKAAGDAPAGQVLIYELDLSSLASTLPDLDGLLKAIDRRLDTLKKGEKVARVRQLPDSTRIEVALLGNVDRQRVERLLARPGTLEFRVLADKRKDKAVIEQAQKDPSKAEVLDAAGKRLAWWVPVRTREAKGLAAYIDASWLTRKGARDEDKDVLVVADPYNVTGEYLTKAEAATDNNGHPCVGFTFNDAGGQLFAKLTGDHLPDKSGHVTYKLGIILDGELYSAPFIQSVISNRGQITGNFTKAEVAEIVDALNLGSLPLRLRLVENPTIRRARCLNPGTRVGTVACSPDGKLIAVGNTTPTMIMMTTGRSRLADNWQPTVKILDAETGKTVVSLKLTANEEDAVLAATERVSHFEVTALAFSPDGNVVAVGTSIGQVKLFNARTGELVRSLDDEKAKLSDKKTPENWKSLRRTMGSVASLAFSPDGSLLAACGRSFDDFSSAFDGVERLGRLSTGPGRLKVWEVRTGTLTHDLAGHSHATAVAFSPDGSLLASTGRWMTATDHDGTGVILWNPQSGVKLRTIEVLANGGTHAVAFSPNGKLAAIGSVRFDKDTDTSTGAVSVVRAGSGISEWQQTVAGWAGPVAFSPDGKSVVVLCGRRLIQFLDTETGSVKDEIRPADSLPEGGRRSDFAAPHPYLLTWNSLDGGRWNDFAVAPQRHMLVIGGVDKYKQGCVEVWDFNAAEKAASQSGANAGESIAEPVFPQREPGRTRVRVTQFSAMPVSVTHPDKIVSGGNTPKNKEATQP